VKIERSLAHKLLQPWFNWRNDVREKKAAKRALKTWRRVGYFIWGEGRYVAEALENGRGERKLNWMSLWQRHPGPIVQAWLNGENNIESHWIFDRPYMTQEEIDAARQKKALR